MSTNTGFTSADIDESKLIEKNYLRLLQSSYASNANSGVQTQAPTFSTAVDILGHYQAINSINTNDAVMLAPLPLNFNQVMANKLRQQLQLNNPGSPSSTLSLSTIYTDLNSTDALTNGPKSTQFTDSNDADAIESHDSNTEESSKQNERIRSTTILYVIKFMFLHFSAVKIS